jgi:hypothetical protein
MVRVTLCDGAYTLKAAETSVPGALRRRCFRPRITVFVAERIDPEPTTPEHRFPGQLDRVPVQVIVAGEIGLLPTK